MDIEKCFHKSYTWDKPESIPKSSPEARLNSATRTIGWSEGQRYKESVPTNDIPIQHLPCFVMADLPTTVIRTRRVLHDFRTFTKLGVSCGRFYVKPIFLLLPS